MSTTHASQHPEPDTTPIVRLVAETRRVLRSSWVATGLGLTIGVLVGVLLAVALIDLLAPFGMALRTLGFLLVLVPSVWIAFVGVLRPAVRRLRDGAVARQIESKLPGIHNRLVSCVDLQKQEKRSLISPAFYRKLVTEALDRIKNFRPSMVVDFFNLRRAMIAAACSVLAMAAAMGLFSDRLPTALARIAAPWADIPPVSGVHYDVTALVRRGDGTGLPEDVQTERGSFASLRGEPIVFRADVDRGEPQTLVLEMRPEGERPLVQTLAQVDGRHWKYTLIGQEKSFTYRVRGGGTWSRTGRVTIVDRPRIVDLHTRLTYPEYMGIKEPKLGAPQSADVTGPMESVVEVVVHSEGEVEKGFIRMVRPERVVRELTERPEKEWFAGQLPKGVKETGVWEWTKGPEGRMSHTEPAATGEHQHMFTGDVHGVHVEPSASLYAWVWIDPAAVPEALALQWNDGAGWEHRAVWGADKITAGVPGTTSRRLLGPLPAAGQWVRLEAPASEVGLEKATLRGMGFALVGGKAMWGAAGVLGPSRIERDEMVPVGEPIAMALEDKHTWAGQFTIQGNGFYRVELRNRLGYANQTMKEGKIIAISDNPPQVVVERPVSDVSLNEPAKVPLVAAVYDDFGLARVRLLHKINDATDYQATELKKYGAAERSDSLLSSLDIPAMNLKPGDTVRFRVEVRDHHPGDDHVVLSPELIIRLVNDDNAADRRLAQFEQQQDTFQEKLAELISKQAKIEEKAKELEAKYEPLQEKIEQAEAARDEQAANKPEPAKDPNQPNDPAAEKPKDPAAEPLQLDPETQKLLEELRQELAQLAQQEAQNAQLAEQVAKDVDKMAADAAKQELLPQPIIDQMQKVGDAFEEMALNPLKELANDLKTESQANPANAPDVNELAAKAEDVQVNLEAIQNRLEALAEAAKQAQQSPEEAMAALENEMLEQNADLAARDLERLRDFLAQQLDELRAIEKGETEVVEAADTVPENLLAALEKEQDKLERMAEAELAETRRLQDQARPDRMKKRPEFPNAPYHPENDDEYLMTPDEEDTAPDAVVETDDPNAEPDAAMPADEKDQAGEKDDAEKEEMFLPLLGGPKPKLDPRFADKLRPQEKKPKPGADPTAEDKMAERREDLQERGNEMLSELDLAKQALESDRDTLDELLEKLDAMLDVGDEKDPQAMEEAQAENAEGEMPEGNNPPHPADMNDPHAAMAQTDADAEGEMSELRKLMQLPELREAMQLAQRMRQMRKQKPNSQQTPQQQMAAANQSTEGNLQGSPVSEQPSQVLAELDSESRAVIMKLPPRVREELLQGMREEGPAGYRKFIKDYFERLTKVKAR